jgi:hypothetical protein
MRYQTTPPRRTVFYGGDLFQPLVLDIAPPAVISVSESLPFAMGDVDGDSVVDERDARLALHAAVRGANLRHPQQLAADTNKDGKVDSADVSQILRLAENKSPNPPSADSGTNGKTYRASLAKVTPAYSAIVQSTSGQQAELIPVQVLLDNYRQVSGGSFQINFDPSVVEPVGVLKTPLSASFELGHNVQITGRYGTLYVHLSRDEPLEGESGPLFVIDFELKPGEESNTVARLLWAKWKLNGPFGEDFEWRTEVNPIDGEIEVLSRSQDLCEPFDVLNQQDLLAMLLQWYAKYRSRGLPDLVELLTGFTK